MEKALSDVPTAIPLRDVNGFSAYSAAASSTTAEYSSRPADRIMTANGSDLDLDLALNDEMGQAMSLTLGEWDLGSVLQADGLFDLTFDLSPTLFEGFG